MNRINVLETHVFNKIAAGEVVEKPASIIKEFVENSLDAGANEISIEIENGGIDKIRVIDNGHGIHPEDVKSAFLPHATSKIKTVEDLSNISTLGFRGEALASIASVSICSLKTKQKEFDVGKEIVLEGGIVKKFEDAVLNNGTIIEVKDLFYNIPARKKFLRKPKTEESEITNLVVRYILANPNVKFSYFVNGEQIYKTNGTGLEDAIYLVYKKGTLENLINVNFESENLKIHGYISKPTFTKNNRTYQTLIINKRYVVNNLISTCIQNAYQNYLMKGQFPFFVLNMEIPFDSLDVNVHPNKLDVKFENSQKIYGYFYSAISKALLDFNEIKKVDENSLFSFNKNINLPEPNFVGKSFEDDKNDNKIEIKNIGTKSIENEKIENINVSNINNSFKSEKDVFDSYSKLSSNQEVFCDSPIMAKALKIELDKVNINTNKPKEEVLNEKVENKFEKLYSTKTELFDNINSLNYKIIGTCFNTYILLEMNNSLFVLDQHACHERLNYDKLIKTLEEKTLSVQPLLIPYILETNVLETEFLENNLANLKNLGFSVTNFGNNCFKVSTIPSVLYNINVSDFFKEILSDLNSLKKIETTDLLKEKLSQKACKASVRAGDKLSSEDIEILLNKMKKNNMTLSCPHGRPAIIEITQSELEKSFKRKV
ncbi:MAG: DNA mismatch repair endonuclease MutL [Clostridiales bacterium]|nr:DNA mismatch repair endonuclease MutL [Clostridiales bacterium]